MPSLPPFVQGGSTRSTKETLACTRKQQSQIPTEAEGAAALSSAPDSSSSSAGTSGSSSGSGVTHTVTPGESLSSIALANGIPESTLASFNGLSPHASLIVGDRIRIPGSSGTSTVSSSGIPLGAIPSPFGTMYLREDAAAAWNSMRQESLNDYGVDLYPEGPLGAYRSYAQQAQLYGEYLNGTGAPADPPGTSGHNLGIALDLATPKMRSIVDSIGPAFGWAQGHCAAGVVAHHLRGSLRSGVNRRGAFLTSKAAIPQLREAGEGALILVSSVCGLTASAGFGA